MPQLAGLLTYLLVLTRPSSAEESALAEKISDISPDNKFAMRTSYDAEMCKKMFPAEKNDAEKTSSTLQRAIEDQYFFQTIKAIELVSLPGKLVVAELPWDGSAEQTSLTWSRDSDAGEATYRLMAKFDEKAGKFQIISKKKVPSKE